MAEPEFPVVGDTRSLPIPGFPGYRVTDNGHVWSCWRRGGNRWGVGFQNWWRKLKPKTNPDGYQIITMRSAEGRQTEWRIHVLVLTAFVGPRPTGMVACHFPNRDPADNRLTNLRWDTQKNNFADMHAHGTRRIGERNGNSRLTTDLVREVRRRAANGQSQKRIVGELGLKKSTVSLVVRGKAWSHVV